MTFRRSIFIEAPVGRVFEYFKDPSNWQNLGMEGVTFEEVHVTPEGRGTRYRWSLKVAGIHIGGTNEFTEFVPNGRIRDESSRSFEGTWTYTFDAEGTGTRVTIENEQRSFWRLPVLRQLMDLAARGHVRMLQRLKAELEP